MSDEVWVGLIGYGMAGRVFHVGEPGSGAVLKLAVNSVLGSLNEALKLRPV